MAYFEKDFEGNFQYSYYGVNGIILVQRLLQHSSASTTQRYIGIEPQKIETAIQNHAQLI